MTRSLAILAVLILSGGSIAAQEVEWQHAYGADGRNHHPTAIAGAPDGSLFVAGTSTAPGLSGTAPEFWLWKIDPTGKLVQQSAIAAGAEQDRINPSVAHIQDIVLTEGGGALVVEFVLGDPYYVAFDANARVLLTKRLEIPGRRRIYVHRFFAERRGTVLAVGAADGRAFLMRIDAAGKVVWSDRPAVADFLTDGAMLADGSFVTVGYTREKEDEFTLTYFLADGTIGKNVPHKGRRASIAAVAGGLVLVYDRAAGDDRDIHIATVKDGVLSGDVAVPPILLAPYRVAQIVGNRHLIGATTEDNTVAVMVYRDGEVISLHENDPKAEPQHWSLERLNSAPAAALTTVYAGGRPLTTKVGIIRFKEN